MNYQDAQRQAHLDADRCEMNYAVVARNGNQEDGFSVIAAASSKINGLRVFYTAQPGRALYRDYVRDAKAEGIAVMALADWKQAGSLSLAGMRAAMNIRERPKAIKGHLFSPNPDNETICGKCAMSAENEIHIIKKSSKPGSPSRGATKRVWVIADGLIKKGKMPARADVIKVCVDAGINPGTAGVQFSKWRKSKESK